MDPEKLHSVDQLRATPIPVETHEQVKGLFSGVSLIKLIAFYNKYKDSWQELLKDLGELFNKGGTSPQFP